MHRGESTACGFLCVMSQYIIFSFIGCLLPPCALSFDCSRREGPLAERACFHGGAASGVGLLAHTACCSGHTENHLRSVHGVRARTTVGPDLLRTSGRFCAQRFKCFLCWRPWRPWRPGVVDSLLKTWNRMSQRKQRHVGDPGR